MFWRRVRAGVVVIILGCLVAGVVAGCSSGGAPIASSAASSGAAGDQLLADLATKGQSVFDQLFVGAAPGASALLAVGVRGTAAVAYLCDGHMVGTWFSGSRSHDHFELRSRTGESFRGQLSEGALQGTLNTMGAAGRQVKLLAADQDDGFLRVASAQGAVTAGLVILDGTPRGRATLQVDAALLTAGTDSTAGADTDCVAFETEMKKLAREAKKQKLEDDIKAIDQQIKNMQEQAQKLEDVAVKIGSLSSQLAEAAQGPTSNQFGTPSSTAVSSESSTTLAIGKRTATTVGASESTLPGAATQSARTQGAGDATLDAPGTQAEDTQSLGSLMRTLAAWNSLSESTCSNAHR
jgi:hypothetical protein